jgi:hypothetical protein
MTKCDYCGKVSVPFVCPFRGKTFCGEHRLPENHEGVEARHRTPPGSRQTRKEMIRVSAWKEAQSGKFISEDEFHFIKKELPAHTYKSKRKSLVF